MVDHNRGWWTTHGNRGWWTVNRGWWTVDGGMVDGGGWTVTVDGGGWTVDASRVEHKRTARWRVTDGDGSVWNVQVQRMRVIRKAYGNDKVETQVQVGHIDRTRRARAE